MKKTRLILLFIIVILGAMLVLLGAYFIKNSIKKNESKVLNSNYVINLIEKQKIDEYYSKDENNIYCNDSVMKMVDYNTFQSLGYGYAKDKNAIYKNCKLSLFSDLKRIDHFSELVNKIDLSSFEVLNSIYFKDKNIVIFQDRQGGGTDFREINGANPSNFEIIEKQYSKDKNYFYFKSKKSDIVDFNSLDFNLENDLYKNYAKDKYGVYYEGQKINEVDLLTFEVISCQLGTGCFAKDNIYFEDKILEKADVQTFEIMFPDQPEYEKDKNHVWKRGELVKDFKKDINWQDFSLNLEEIDSWELFNDDYLRLSFRIPSKLNNQEIDYTDASYGYMPYEIERYQIIGFGLPMEENEWRVFDHNYTIEIYPFLEVKDFQKELLVNKGNYLMDDPLYLIVNNNKVILYSEMGMLPNKTAIIFGTDNTIIFHLKSGDNSDLNKIDEFKKILSTINLK